MILFVNAGIIFVAVSIVCGLLMFGPILRYSPLCSYILYKHLTEEDSRLLYLIFKTTQLAI